MDPDPSPLLSLFAPSTLAFQLAIDPGTLIIQFFLLVVLLLCSALFSGSEVALFSIGGPAKESLLAASDRASQRVLRLLERPGPVLVTILIMNTLVNVAAAILAAVITKDISEAFLWPARLTLILEVIVLTFVLLVVSEITPKLIATRHALAFSRNASGFLLLLHRLLGPLSRLLARSMQFANRISRYRSRLSGDDLKTMAEIGRAHGTLEEEERELIHSIIEFGDTTAREIMISRLDVVALPVTSTLDEAMTLIRDMGHSRIPLYVDHLDNILGVIYAKDLLRYLARQNGTPRVDWTRIARKPIFVPLGKKLDELLRDFQTRKTHIAIVVDEYGGTAGVVTMEDVLEEIVGEIHDEHDEVEDAPYEQVDEVTYVCDARVDLDDLNEIPGIDLATEDFDFETLGGLIFDLTGAVPTEGDEVAYDNLRLRVETVESNRIGRVVIEVQPPDPPPDDKT